MRLSFRMLFACLVVVLVLPGDARADRRPPGMLTNVQQCLDHVRDWFRPITPFRVEATVTLLDRQRDVVVLQDASAAMGVCLPLTNGGYSTLQPGQRVLLQGAGVLPYIRSFPDYPERPTGREYPGTFEVPLGTGTYYLTRMRGYLHPPVTGRYTFWIAADDAGEFWLSTSADPAMVRRICGTIGSTGRREWARFSGQRSRPVELKAGERYYVEALQMQGVGPDCLAIAWEGPGLPMSVIEGQYLSPWEIPGQSTAGLPVTNCILREYWDNYFVRNFFPLHFRSQRECIVRVRAPALKILGEGAMPEPMQTTPEDSPGVTNSFRWAEIEGTVNYAAASGDVLRLEVAGGKSNMVVRVLNWNAGSTERLHNARVRIQGVIEAGVSSQGRPAGGVMWVPFPRFLATLPPEKDDWSEVGSAFISEVEPSNPLMTWGRRLKVRGRVAGQSADSLLLQGNDIVEGFLSPDGTNWTRIGKPTEIGMSNSVLIGLVVASHQTSEVATATFELPGRRETNWLGADLGDSGRPGRFEFKDSAWAVTGSGRRVWSAADQCYFVYQPLEGEGEITARLASFASPDRMGQAGVMIRESLDRGAACASIVATPAHGARLQCRKIPGEFTVQFVPPPHATNNEWMKLVRRRNCLPVRTSMPTGFSAEQQLDVVGTLVWENNMPELTEASFRKVDPKMAPSSAVGPQRLRNISVEQFLAEAQQPSQPYVRGYLQVAGLRGVVTFCDRVFNAYTLFVQDDSAGVSLVWPETNLTVSLQVGQRVDVSGRSMAGHFPVTIEPSSVTVMGWGSISAPVSYSGDRATGQSRHGRWVQVEGVVRSIGKNGTLNLMAREGLVIVWVGRTPAGGLKENVNARVRVRGVLSSPPDEDPMLLVPSPEYIEMAERPPADPFVIPAFAIADLADLNVRPDGLRLMKVSGIVTCVCPKGMFVQDKSGGAFVRTVGEPSVQPADKVEVVGFPEGSSSVVLSEALVRKTGVGSMPEPARFVPQAGEEIRYAGSLVQMDATVVEQRSGPERQVLILQAGPAVFEAVLAASTGDDRLPALPAGSRVAVTGVCQVDRGETGTGREESNDLSLAAPFQIWLRSPGDIALLQRAPWLTWRHAAIAACFFACALLSALLWVRMLRRRVAQRTHQLREAMSRLEKETHTSAVLAERDRLAGEIHDSLEQGLTAIMLQLDAAIRVAKNPEEARRYLDMARSMAGFSKAEVRRAVWDLQSPLLEDTDLGTALEHVAGDISVGDSQRVTVKITGDPRPMPSSIEHHLLRIGQEAITNAVKHGRSRTIQVGLDYSEGDFRLSVRDDGQGFVPDAALCAGRNGHFGLQGIRERARKINARLEIISQPGQGATISVTVPLGDGVQSDGSALTK